MVMNNFIRLIWVKVNEKVISKNLFIAISCQQRNSGGGHYFSEKQYGVYRMLTNRLRMNSKRLKKDYGKKIAILPFYLG
jgi:hypothetical protein